MRSPEPGEGSGVRHIASHIADPANATDGLRLRQGKHSSAELAKEVLMSGLIWIVVVGFVAGIIARVLSPGPNNPGGFILTTVLGIAGAFLATFIGQTIGWYRYDQGAGFIAATLGALIVLFIWNRLVVHRAIPDPGGYADSGTWPPRR